MTELADCQSYPLADRIAGALTAYACGDALGLPWEGRQAPRRTQWPLSTALSAVRDLCRYLERGRAAATAHWGWLCRIVKSSGSAASGGAAGTSRTPTPSRFW